MTVIDLLRAITAFSVPLSAYDESRLLGAHMGERSLAVVCGLVGGAFAVTVLYKVTEAIWRDFPEDWSRKQKWLGGLAMGIHLFTPFASIILGEFLAGGVHHLFT